MSVCSSFSGYVSICLLHCLSIRSPIRGSTKFDNCFQIAPSLQRIHAPLANINRTNTQRTHTARQPPLLLSQNCYTHTAHRCVTTHVDLVQCTRCQIRVQGRIHPDPISRVASYPELRSLVPFGRIWV
jgi:hypothetical protein